MLIVCSGPDTFRALKKARELEVAFKNKYDAQGLSVEHISAGKAAVTEIAARAGAVSLFASRRFVRTANIFAEATKAQRTTLKKVLLGDQDGFILLSLEDEPPAVFLKEFEPEVKVVRYDFPALRGEAFLVWARGEARDMGLSDERAAQAIAKATEGDSWSCFFELMKRAVYVEAETPLSIEAEDSIFSFADAYLAQRPTWWELASQADLVKQAATTFMAQARSALRVRDQAIDGLHPFVVRKLRGRDLASAETLLARTIESFCTQRAGYGDDKEGLTLF